MRSIHKCISKIFIVLAIVSTCANIARCQVTDTTICYFKFLYTASEEGFVAIQVESIQDANYIRVVMPPDKGDDKPNVQEFYKNGKIKLAGKLAPGDTSFHKVNMELEGECVTFYPTGKRESEIKYSDGNKNGDEYLYYPDGKLYCHLKNQLLTYTFVKTFWLECYNKQGDEICKNGTGQWIIYDLNYDHVIVRGQVKKDYQEGLWLGNTFRPDSIKYTYLYENGGIQKGTGYDKNGIAYKFNRQFVQPYYDGGVLSYIQAIRNHIKWPGNINETKKIIDTMHVSFIIGKDGKVSDINVIGSVNESIREAIVTSVKKCSDWIPAKYYGIPFRTNLILPLKYFNGSFGANSDFPILLSNGTLYGVYVSYYQRLLDF